MYKRVMAPRHYWKRLIVVAAGALVLAGCAPSPAPRLDYHGDPNVRGSVAKVERIDGYSLLHMRGLLWLVKFPEPVPISQGIALYRISYWSVTDGKAVLVSGLISVPGNGTPRGTVLWMHGTHDNRKDSVSYPGSSDGILPSGLFAGAGYVLLAPDLVGLGVSQEPQAYLYNPSTIDVTLDFLRAAQTVTKDFGLAWNSNLYLVGFSEGGHAAAVIQRELEQHSNPAWQIKASAGIAGPYKLADISFSFALHGQSPEDSLYMATVALSYATYYHQPLGSVLTERYAQIVPSLFDGDHALDDIRKVMPADPRSMFTTEFLEAFDRKAPNWFSTAWRDNQIDAWAPKAPFRAYFGEKDIDVSPLEAKTFVTEAKSLGGDAELVSVGPYDHNESVLHAAPLVRRWFDELTAAGAAR